MFVVHVSASLVEMFKQKQILTIVSIKRMSNDDCEDKNRLNHCSESIIICMKFSIYVKIHEMHMYVCVSRKKNLLAKVCYLLNK